MRDDEIALEQRSLVGGNALRGQLPEAGIDAIDGEVGLRRLCDDRGCRFDASFPKPVLIPYTGTSARAALATIPAAASTRGQNEGSRTTDAPSSTRARSSRLTVPGLTTIGARCSVIVPSTPGGAAD